MILNFEGTHFGVKENAHSLRLRGLKKILIKSILASLSGPARNCEPQFCVLAMIYMTQTSKGYAQFRGISDLQSN